MVVGTVLGLTALAACAEPGDDSEIVGGNSPTARLTEELTRLGVTLPPDATRMSWLMASTWDTNDTYVRLSASRSSILHLLRQDDIDESSLVPLAQAQDHDRVLPAAALSGIPTHVARPADLGPWSLREADRSSAVAYPMDDDLPSVGAIVLDPTGTHPTVFLHWHR